MSIDQNNFLITEDTPLTRIDRILTDKFLSNSRTYFQYLIDSGCVLVNGKKVKKRFIPKVNDEVEVFFQALEESSLEPENIPLDILYEDEDIIAINKPAGMVVHPACGNWSKTFVNALLYHCKELKNIQDNIRPGIVHRLDKDTSGVLLAAKTLKAQQNLIEQFKNRKVLKKYLAIAGRKIENQTINAPISRHAKKRKEMAIVEGGKEAITQVELLSYNEKISLILATPKTGRTHQIRIHLKHKGCPILGDQVYGSNNLNKNFNINRQLLHAYVLEFSHPIKNKPMKIVAPIAKDFQKFIEILNYKIF